MVNSPAEVPQVNRLDQVVQGAPLHAKSCTRGVIHRRKHEDSNGGLEIHDLGHQLDPIDPGEVHIQQYAGDFLPLQDGQGFFTGGRGGDLVSLQNQELPERVTYRFFVVYNEQCDRPIGKGHANSSTRAWLGISRQVPPAI
jgi:hypothetical protein